MSGRARTLLATAALLVAAIVGAARPARALEPGKRADEYAHAAWPTVAHASSVQTIRPSPAGHLWVGTSEGLVRFDGQRVTTFDPRRVRGAADGEVRAVLEASDGRLWVGAFRGGLSRLEADRQTAGHWGPEEGMPEGFLFGLVETADGTIWSSGRHGVHRFPRGRPLDRPVPTSEGLPALCTHALTVDGGGTLWAGTHAGLARWTGQRWQAEAGGPPAGSFIDVVVADRDRSLWLGTRTAGLWQRTPEGRWRSFTVDAGLGSLEVTAVLRDRQGTLWVATRGGNLTWLDGDRFRAFPPLPRLCTDRVQALAEDAEGGLWIGTEQCGLHRLADQPFRLLTTADGLASDRILGVGALPGGDLLVGMRGGGMSRLRAGQNTFEPVRCSAGQACEQCWDFSVSPAGGAWAVCRTNVVLRWDGQALARVDRLPGGMTEASFAVEARDGALWLALEKKVVRVHQGVTTRLHDQEVFQGPRILFEGGDGTMWIATEDAVIAWRDGKTQVVRLPSSERPAEVANFHQDAAGVLWMATKGEGIRRLRHPRDQITTVGVGHGLPTGWIVQLLEDDHGRLWASSSKGLFSVEKRQLEELADGKRPALHAALYDASDGIQMRPDPFGHPAGFKDRAGRLWFATNGGLAVVEPPAQAPAPRVTIEQVRLGGERVELGRPIAGRAPSDLDVTFSASTFAPPDTVSFRYRLREGDGDWVEIGSTRTLHHARLEPGDYQLTIAARTRHGTWSAEPTRLAFTLRPPFHRSPAFALLAALAAGLVLFAAHRARIARTRAELQTVMAERTRIAREVHDTLAQAFVATSVQLECLEEALEGDPRAGAKARRHLETARKVVEESLDEARRAVWVLRPQAIESGLVPALQTLVERVSGGTGAAVELAVSGTARELPPLVASNLLRIAHEAVANAHRHARARRIALTLAFEPRRVALSVADDGRGMLAANDVVAPGDAHGASQGIIGMKERAAQIGGTLSIEGTSERGTTVRVEVAA